MSQQRFVALLVAAVLVISGALYLSAQRNQQHDTHGGALLPWLPGEIYAVTVLTVRRASPTPTVTLHQQAGRWTVAERGDYPADVSKLRKLLLALSDAKIVEEKTSSPASFSIIGVDDPSAQGAVGAEIGITAKDGNHKVIIGKPVGEGNFARRVGENLSYSVEPAISFESEPRFWIDSQLLDVASANIQSIQIKPATGPGYELHRAPPAAKTPPAGGAPTSGSPPPAGTAPAAATGAATASETFLLDGVPPGRKAADSASLAPSPTALAGLTADDVLPVGNVDFTKPTVAVVTLSNGSVITLNGATSGDKHWVTVQSSKDAALNARTAGRAFEIASYRYDGIFRPLEQLLVPKAPPPAPKPPATAKPPAIPKPSSAVKPAPQS